MKKRILLVDAFAGPGKTDDGEPGSPLLICKAAEKYAKGRYLAYFVNKDKSHHQQLKAILRASGYENSTMAILGDGPGVLEEIAPTLTNQTVFIYGISRLGLDRG